MKIREGWEALKGFWYFQVLHLVAVSGIGLAQHQELLTCSISRKLGRYEYNVGLSPKIFKAHDVLTIRASMPETNKRSGTTGSCQQIRNM